MKDLTDFGKVCRWTKRCEGWWKLECGGVIHLKPLIYKICPRCGGRIEATLKEVTR